MAGSDTSILQLTMLKYAPSQALAMQEEAHQVAIEGAKRSLSHLEDLLQASANQ